MKKHYQSKKKATSYRVRPSKYYSAYTVVVNGREVAWGDKATMEARRHTMVRNGG